MSASQGACSKSSGGFNPLIADYQKPSVRKLPLLALINVILLKASAADYGMT
ncbi:MAG TPA: hypothetical protein PK874_11560 [Desulfobacteraceae bacterium]|nr:hypothetical protein [Desulfobacteraceae bacterium]